MNFGTWKKSSMKLELNHRPMVGPMTEWFGPGSKWFELNFQYSLCMFIYEFWIYKLLWIIARTGSIRSMVQDLRASSFGFEFGLQTKLIWSILCFWNIYKYAIWIFKKKNFFLLAAHVSPSVHASTTAHMRCSVGTMRCSCVHRASRWHGPWSRQCML